MTVAGIDGVTVAVAVGSPGVVVGAAKDIVAVKAEAATMAPRLIRHAPKAEAVVRSTGRPDSTVHIAMDGRAAVVRAATASIVPLLRRWEARANPVGSECPKMTLVGNDHIPFWWLPLKKSSTSQGNRCLSEEVS